MSLEGYFYVILYKPARRVDRANQPEPKGNKNGRS